MPGITVAQVLTLEEFKPGKLLTGNVGLDKVVQYVDVIEVPDAALWFHKNSLLFTTFYAVKNNVDAQVQMVEDMVNTGGAGLVVFSPERYLRELDRRVVGRAQELGLPVIQMPDTPYVTSILSVLNAVLDKQLDELRFVQEIQQQMTSLVLDGKGLNEIAYILAAFLHYPVVITGCDFIPRVYVNKDTTHSLEGDSEDTESSQELNRLRRKYFSHTVRMKLSSEKKPVYLESGEESCYYYPVAIKNQVYACILVLNLPGKLEKGQTLLIQASGTTTAVEIIKESAMADLQKKVRLDFFENLLWGNIPTEEAIACQAKAIGINMEGKNLVLVMQAEKPLSYQQVGHEELEEKYLCALENIKGAIRLRLQKSIPVEKGNNIIVFACAHSEQACRQAAKVMREICEYYKETEPWLRLSVGLGSRAKSLGQLSRSYREAMTALQLGQKLYGSRSCYEFGEIELYQLLAKKIERDEIEGYFQRCFGSLLEHDQLYKGDLLKTFEAYLFTGQSMKDTATRLYIHRNSLKYRLAKIEELLQLDFNDPLQVFKYNLLFILKRVATDR
jgi:purine catabolism regulator